MADFLIAEFQPPKAAEDEKIVIDLDGEGNATPQQPVTKSSVPEGWECKKHDKCLIKAVSDHGFDKLSELSDNNDCGFKGIQDISSEFALKRISKICEYFRHVQNQTKVPKKAKFSYESIALKQTAYTKEAEPTTNNEQLKLMSMVS